MNLLQPDRLDRLAREYVLGTLGGGARRRFERLLQAAPEARAAVQAWQHRLGRLATELPPMAPREAVWRGLEQRLFGAAPAARPSWRQRLGALLSGRVLGGALAGLLAGVVLIRTEPQLAGLEVQREALPASYVGLLSDAAGTPTVLLSSRRHGRVLSAKLLQPIAVPPGRVAQLWALPKDGAPFPVGVLPATGTGVITLPDSSEKLFFHVARLGVSLEERPAAAGAVPGAFVVSGPCVKLW